MKDGKDYGHLKEVPKVEKIYKGKQHLSSLGDRIMGVIDDFSQQAADQDIQVTYSEVIGTLRLVEHDLIRKVRRQCGHDD